jgi:hypothetical protein
VLIVNLRLLGVGLSRQPVAQLSAAVEPWLLASLALMFVSGTLLFLSESIKCLYNFAFWVKMASLFLVIIFTFTIQRRVTRLPASARPLSGPMTAVISLVLWFGVAGGGLDRIFVGAAQERDRPGEPPDGLCRP